MELQELKTRLKITDTSQDAFLAVALEDAIDYTKQHCNQSFEDDNGVLAIPPSVKKGIALLVKSMNENGNVSSQSLGDMSKSFFEGATLKEAHTYFKPYKKVRFV
jgi:hypothetical protein